jgi:hypothetical protein
LGICFEQRPCAESDLCLHAAYHFERCWHFLYVFPPIILLCYTDPSSADEVKSYILKVNIPQSYTGPSDADQLGTIYTAYIPTDQVSTLASQIKALQSTFYHGLNDPTAQQLAARVVSSFSVTSVADPLQNGGGGGSSGSTGQLDTSGATQQSKTRKDAIIGVVTTIGGIALIVLAYLIYRSYMRRNELKAHRLSDPPEMQSAAFLAGVRSPAHDFDQDSIGGQRRRSFYFAQDSLRDATSQIDAWNAAQTAQQGGPSPSGQGVQQYHMPSQAQVREMIHNPFADSSAVAVGGSSAVPMSRGEGGSNMVARRIVPGSIGNPMLQSSSVGWEKFN